MPITRTDMMFQLPENVTHSANIKVFGVGGGGGNALEYMINQNIEGVEFISANTDAQALHNSKAPTIIQLGEEITKGLGAGADPNVGRSSAEESREQIRDVLIGADMVFITAGMGGGTGTGAAPVFAEVAKSLGILTVAVVTKPFNFEGKKRSEVAERGIQQLAQYVDSLITIPNTKLLEVLGDVSLLEAFQAANDVLLGAVQGIAELITRPGLINVDFADVRTVMSEMGMAMMGTGSGVGENRAEDAAQAAISSPLLEDIDLSGARGVLANITAGNALTIKEFNTVGSVIESFTSKDANVVVGTVIDPSMNDSEELRVTVVATGLRGGPEFERVKPAAQREPKKHDGTIDYHQLEKPTILRSQPLSRPVHSESSQKYEKPELVTADLDIDDTTDLDIPAFLRREAD